MNLMMLRKETLPLRSISEDRRYREAAEKLAKFQNELRELRKAIDRENASWYARQSSSVNEDAIDRADRMLDGQNLADDRSTQTKLAELEERVRIIRPAITKQQEIVGQIRGELSVAAAKLVRDRHRKALVEIRATAIALVAAGAAERRIRGELLDLGFEAIDALLPGPRLAAPLALGDENICDSPLWHYARQLEDLGILP
jgi:hypothetical protein